MKKIVYTIAMIGLVPLISSKMQAQTATLQVIHNSADAAADTVDIYAGNALLIDNLQFRYASQTFTNIPAGTNIVIGIAPATSTAATDAIATFTVNFAANSNNVVVADGIASPTGYTPGASTAGLTLKTYSMALAAAASNTVTSLLVHHGSTDAPTVDVVAPFTGANPFSPNVLVNNAAYGDFSNGYVTLPTADYRIQIRDQNSENVVAEYQAPLSTLNLGGAALTVIASGFLNPANNSNGAGFGLYVASAAGGSLLPLPTSTISSTRLQAIHNCADAAAAQVDVWVKTANTVPTAVRLIDDFAFRTASPFVDVPAAENVTVYVSAPSSTSEIGAITQVTYNLSSSTKYQLIASGIVSGTGYSPAPAFNFGVFSGALERSTNTSNTDVLVYHGATDAPAVNILAEGSGTLVSNLAYGNFNPAGYLQLPSSTTAGNYTLHITNTAGTATVASFGAPLNTLGTSGLAVSVLASGFLDPSLNSNGAAFGLYAALPIGGPLVPLPKLNALTTGIVDANKVDLGISAYPNPLSNQLTIANSQELEINYSLRDYTGKVIREAAFTTVVESLDVNELPQGIYFLTVNNAKGQTTIKLVK